MATPAPPIHHPVIRVRTRSHVDVVADRAHLLVHLSGSGSTANRAAAALKRSHARMTRALTRFDATVTHAHVEHTSTEPLANGPEDDSADASQTLDNTGGGTSTSGVTWVARARVRVDVSDTTGLHALYTALTKSRAGEVTAPQWSLRPDHPAHALVRRDAVRSATQQARELAEAASSRLVALDWIEDTESLRPAPGLDAPPDRCSAGPSPVLLEPALQTVAVTVTAQYRIAPIVFDRTN